MAQDVVGRRRVEEEVRQRVVEQIGLAREVLGLFAAAGGDGARFAAVDVRLRQAFQEGDGFYDARFQFGKALLAILIGRHGHAGQTRAAALGEVGSDLDLAHERQHVREQAELQQGVRVDFLVLHVRFRLVQDGGQAAQDLFEDGDRCGIDGEGHGGSSR
ncbi:hypothetical protein D3C81_1790990 [compost metagenome]